MAIPIPARTPGWKIGSGDAPIQIEVFLDLQCLFSQKCFPTILNVLKKYSKEICAHFCPIVIYSHRQAWAMTKAALIVAEGNPNKWVQFVSYLFENASDFKNDIHYKKSEEDLNNLLVSHIVKFSKMDEKEIKEIANIKSKIEGDSAYLAAKPPIRLAAKRGVWSTPTFFINGSEATTLSSSSDMKSWEKAIDELLGTSSSSSSSSEKKN